MELAPSQQPPETEASTAQGLLHPEATIPGHSHTSNDLDVPAVAQEQLASGELQGQVAGTVDNPARRPLGMKISNLSEAKTAKPSTEDAAQSPIANTISDEAAPEVRLTMRSDEQRMSETWEKRQRRFSRPMGIKKTEEKARAQDHQNRNTQARLNRGPVTESSGPVPHQDEWAAIPNGQEEHKASSMPAPEPPTTTELRAETASPGDQPTTVMAESSQAAPARSARKILKPRIVVRPGREVRRVPSEPNPNSQAVTIIFRARGNDGVWKTVRELQVNPSDPSEVERLARKDARNRNATFYDKNLRKLTPAQCFEAAIEDETNTIFMKFDGELVMDEETMVSIARDIEL